MLPSLYRLLYHVKSELKTLPGSDEKFVLQRYKEEIDKSYGRITFYLLYGWLSGRSSVRRWRWKKFRRTCVCHRHPAHPFSWKRKQWQWRQPIIGQRGPSDIIRVTRSGKWKWKVDKLPYMPLIIPPLRYWRTCWSMFHVVTRWWGAAMWHSKLRWYFQWCWENNNSAGVDWPATQGGFKR